MSGRFAAMDVGEFISLWQSMSIDERNALPPHERQEGFARYARETAAVHSVSPAVNLAPYMGVQLIRGDFCTPTPVEWHWRNRLPAGEIVILGGAPGTGKTTLALSMLATATRGGHWPDGTRAPTLDVLIWSGEDDIERTLAPRLIVNGADMERVNFVAGMVDADGARAFDPAIDCFALEDKMRILQPGILMVDPIVSAVAGDSHKNAEVRRSLQPLVELARTIGCTIIGITHFTKGTQGRDPVERISGSLAFGALARVVLVTARRPEWKGGQRILAVAKSNLGPDDGGHEYEIGQEQLPAFP